MGLVGIIIALALLMWLAYRGWSTLLVAPLAALVAAALSGEPLLAHWTITFMQGAARFFAQWFPMFLLGGLFGKLMDDSGSITSIANFLSERLGTRNTILSVVIASAVVTYGGISVFVAFFVLVPMAQTMFRAADIPKRLLPATIGLGAFTFTMSALPGTPSVNNAIPMPYFQTTTFAAPGLGLIASAITLAFGLWWLARVEARAQRGGEGFGGVADDAIRTINEPLRMQAAAAGDFDPAEICHGQPATGGPPFSLAVLPLAVVIVVNFLMALIILPMMDFSFLKQEVWGGTNIGAISGVWSVVIALAAANLAVILINFRRLPSLRNSLDAGASSAALPILMISSLVGFGAVVAALPAFSNVAAAVMAAPGGPLISLTIAMNALAALTGTASGGMAIALNALGGHFMWLSAEYNINPELMHRVTTISAGTLDALPHNGTVLLLLKICNLTHRESYFDMVMTVIVSVILSLIAVLVLGSMFGSF
jgi:H+/gluconate symporter-like permease